MMKPIAKIWRTHFGRLLFHRGPALDFLGLRQYSQVGLFIVSGLLLVLALWLLLDYRDTMQQLKNYEAQHPTTSTPSRPVRMDAQLESALQLAQKTTARLNTPWEPLFAALEQAQQGIAVHLLSIEPQTGRDELVLTGAVADFPTLLRYVAQLRQQPMLKEPTIINQRWQQEVLTNPDQVEMPQSASSKPLLNFTLSLNWVQP